MKLKTLFFLAGILFLAAILLNGCATVPARPGFAALPVYNIDGLSYVALIQFCQQRGVKWDYDTFSRCVTLSNDLHRVNLKVGETLAIIDGRSQSLAGPVDVYQGTLVVPLKFKERYLDVLFQGRKPAYGRRIQIPLSIKEVVIDPGHGGNDPGAIGRTGLREKDINLDIAKKLAKLFEDSGVRVVMTRSADRFIPLSRRVDIANNSNADLFISIHSNANRVKSLNGFEVYYISPNLSDSRRALFAAQHARLNLNRSWFASDSLNLRATLWDMIYVSSRAESITLARTICQSIDRELETKVLGTKGANFYVLRGVRMPAVLIEIGFVSNAHEELLLKNSYYRQQIAESIAAGVSNYARDYAIMEASR